MLLKKQSCDDVSPEVIFQFDHYVLSDQGFEERIKQLKLKMRSVELDTRPSVIRIYEKPNSTCLLIVKIFTLRLTMIICERSL